MFAQSITVSAPTRLHFGLLSFGNPHVPQFGGVGAMVNGPRLQLHATSAASFQVTGYLSERVVSFVNNWLLWCGETQPPAWHVHVDSQAQQHRGLGVGTQLGLATATLLCLLQRRLLPAVEELAKSVGRGQRSAVGTHGFALGGLISELGKLEGERIAPLQTRVALPSDWRFLLITPRLQEGASGWQETQLFKQLPPVPARVTEELTRILLESLLPAARSADCRRFGEAVYHYGKLAGECFTSVQGGAYNGPRLEKLVSAIRQLGVPGVGQSSWGPTIFAILESQQDANELCKQLLARGQLAEAEYQIASPNNSGATISLYQTKCQNEPRKSG